MRVDEAKSGRNMCALIVASGKLWSLPIPTGEKRDVHLLYVNN